MLNDDLVNEILEQCEQGELNRVWDYASEEGDEFSTRRSAFLWVLERMLRTGRVKLKHMHTKKYLTGTIEEQVALFNSTLPKTTLEADKHLPSNPDFASDVGTGRGMYYWFFDESCPSGIAWLVKMPDGSCEWR